MPDGNQIISMIGSILLVGMVGGALYFDYQKQPKTDRPQSKYMMDDYGNIYSVQPCQNCQSCFEFHKVDTAEIKVKAFDFVPR